MRVRNEVPQTPTPVPTVPAIDRIQQILASAGAPGAFATRRTAGWASISLAVVGVGKIPLPLSHRTADKLRAVAKPARYGLREETLLDPRVRDTWEISTRQLVLDERAWQLMLERELPRIGRDLGVPDGTTLRAELHNLLVYEPGPTDPPLPFVRAVAAIHTRSLTVDLEHDGIFTSGRSYVIQMNVFQGIDPRRTMELQDRAWPFSLAQFYTPTFTIAP
jgi:hypothetical protein